MSDPGATTSVVVASFRRLDLLAQCLDSLRSQCREHGAELVVARANRDEPEALARLTEGCRVALAPAEAGIPHLRGLGMSQAPGEWVAITEDHCVADPGWLGALLAARTPGVQILGGSMGNARPERRTDWGAFFAEYGFYGAVLDRDPARGSPLITEANACYHRSVVAKVAAWARSGCWENVIHDRLWADGHKFRLVPGARILQNLTYRLGEFCRDRYQHGRAYARTRSAGLSRGRRVALLAGTPFLPVLLARRIFRSVAPVERKSWLRGFAPMLLFLTAWALGEAEGYASGKLA